MRPYVIHGAGAVGSALAGYLSRAGHRVLVTAREDHVRAVREHGLRVHSRDGDFVAFVEAHTAFPDALPADAVLCITVQSPDVAAAARAAAAAAALPVVTWQNGVAAEEAAAPFFPRLYGGVVRFTATRLEPGEVRVRAPGTLIVGRHPRGVDAVARSIVGDLGHAGFDAAVSPDVGADKALKLLVNLVSGVPVLLRRTEKDPALAAVQVALLEEARAVFDRAGVAAYPASGKGQTVEALLAHFRAGGSAPDTAGGIYNSTWQNLHHRRPRLENGFYHGEIIRLGKETGVATPVNARVLEILETVRREGLGPEPFDPETFRSRFADLVDVAAVSAKPAPEDGSLEI
jgi:2-dehydropantoate 2-reductase